METKVFIMIVIILSLSQRIFSQYSQKWIARVDNSSGSYLAVDNLGNVHVTGVRYSRYLTIKYNSNGNELWTRMYNQSYQFPNDVPHAIALDSYGNVYVTGEAKGSTYFYMDYATVKYDSNGNQIWVNTYNSPFNDHDRAIAMEVDKSNNVFVTGNSVTPCINGSFTWNTIKYSPAGSEIWVARFCGYTGYIIGGYAPPPALAIDSSGNIIIAGSSDSASAYLSNYGSIIIKYDQAGQELWVKQIPLYSSFCLVAADNLDNIYFAAYRGSTIKVIKFNSNGDSLWVRDYNNLFLKKIIVDKWKNVYVAGTAYGGGFITVKYDSNGVQQWVAIDIIGKYLNSMTIDDSGNIYQTGYTALSVTSNYYTAKYDRNGSKLWSSQYNGPANSSDIANDISVDNFGNIFVTGSSRGTGTSNECTTIEYSIITNSNNNSSEVIGFNLYQNFPNPFNPNTIINYSLSNTQYTMLKVYNVLGKEIVTLVNKKQNAGSYSIEFDGTNFPSGIYYYKLEAGSFSEVRKMILFK